MTNGLFQSAKQIRDAQFAADAAGGTGAGGGVFSQIGGSIGRALSGSIDPRITLAKEFEGRDLNKIEDLQELMVSANNLGLQSEALQIADRIRTVTPKKEKPTILSQGQKAFNDKGEVLFSNPKDAPKETTFGPKTSFTDPSGKAVTGQWGSDGKFYKIAEGFNPKSGDGGSGASGEFKPFTTGELATAGTILQNFGNRLEGFEGFDLDEAGTADAQTIIAQGVRDYAKAAKVSFTEARSKVEEQLRANVEDVFFDDSINVDGLQNSMATLVQNVRGKAVQTPTLSGVDADALAWAKANPDTRQAKEIRKRLGQ